MLNNEILARFCGDTVAMVNPRFASRLLASVRSIDLTEARKAEMSQSDFWPEPGSWMNMLRPYIVRKGVLHIPVKGALLHAFPYALFDWATGYEYIREAVKRGMEDTEVKGIAFIVDSFGGEVSGNMDLNDFIYSYRGTKPMRAIVAEHAYSAAYSIASCADKIVVARTGGTGSIGVVTMHLDMSKALENEGLKVTYIYAGRHKVDGSPFLPLSSDAKEHIQSQIDEMYDLFVKTVSRNRGMPEADVRATEAQDYTATESVRLGLADEIGSLEESMVVFATDLSRVDETGDTDMTKPNEAPANAPAAETPAVAPQAAAPDAAALDEARKAGAKAEQDRVASIMGLPEAKHRQEQALAIVSGTSLSVDEAKRILAASPEVKSDAGTTFAQAMIETGNPELGAPGGEQKGEGEGEVEAILASFRGATGFPKRK